MTRPPRSVHRPDIPCPHTTLFRAKPFERHFGKRQSGLRDRRIVERAVKPAERRKSLRDKCLHVLSLCDVAPEIGGLPARRSHDRLTGLVVDEIGRAHVRTPVTNAHLVCRLLLETKKTTTN